MKSWCVRTAKILLMVLLLNLINPGLLMVTLVKADSVEMALDEVRDTNLELVGTQMVLLMNSSEVLEQVISVLPANLVTGIYKGVKSITIYENNLAEVKRVLTNHGLLEKVQEIFKENIGAISRRPYDTHYYMQWNMKAINMEAAWDYTPDNNDVKVAVIDTGISPYYELPMLVDGVDVSTGYWKRDDFPGEYSYDGSEHGTAIASLIAAEHNYEGMAGVNQHINLMSVKVVPDGETTTSSIKVAEGIYWAVIYGAKIINISIGFDQSDTVLKNAIDFAESREVFVVAATGNAGNSNKIDYPAAYPYVFAVGSTDKSNNVSSFSNRGEYIDLVAPGDNIISFNMNQQLFDHYYGTSFAAASVTGAASMLSGVFSSSGITVDELKYALTKSATDLQNTGWDNISGNGLLDVYAAIKFIEGGYGGENRFNINSMLIYPNELIKGHIVDNFDSEIYKFKLLEENQAIIKVTNPDKVKMYLDLYDEDLQKVESAIIDEDQTLFETSNQLSTGTYYIELRSSGDYSSMRPYSIIIDTDDTIAPEVIVLEKGTSKIEDEGRVSSNATLSVSDSSKAFYTVYKNEVSIGQAETVYEQGNYKVIAEDSEGNQSIKEFVVDYDGFLTVTFEVEKNVYLRTQSIEYGKPIEFLPAPTKDGLVFTGWYKDQERSEPWIKENPVKKNLTLYAKWEELLLESIEVVQLPTKVAYIKGEELNIDGLQVIGHYNDGTAVPLTITKEDIFGFNSLVPTDKQILTVIKEGKTAEFEISVREIPIVRIEIRNLPEKLIYIQGEPLLIEGLTVVGIYEGNYERVINHDELSIKGFDNTAVTEKQTLTVTVEGKSADFEISIIKKVLTNVVLETYPTKMSYFVGEKFRMEGLVLSGTYNDGSSNEIDISEVSVLGFDSSVPLEAQTITLSVAEWSFELIVDILPEPALQVLAGTNRYRTAVAISQASYVQSDTVILVQANNFPDALAAGPLAFMMDAPILLTSPASLSSSVKEEMKRLEAKKIIIMGGYSAVSANVEQVLNVEGYTVERLEGSNRYSTAVVTAKYMEEKLGIRNTVVMASGNQFADALAAGSYAAKEGYPILLTDGNRLTKATMDHITESGVENIILVGGTSVISEALENQLRAMGISITRKSGKNRFDTSLEIARSYFGNSETAVVANGMEFADALAAAPYAAKLNAPIILVNQTRINLPIKEYLPTSMISKIVVVGGDAAINEAVRNELKELIE